MNFHRFALHAGLLAASFLSPATAVFAQVAPIPDAGAVSREIQRAQENRAQKEQSEVAPLVAPRRPATQIGPAGGATIRLKQIKFDPSEFLSASDLNEIAARYVGRDVDNAQVQSLLKEVNDLYAARRLTTALAYLPSQNLEKGVLHVALLEAKLGKMTVQGTKRLPEDMVTDHIQAPEGKTLDLPKLEREVAWFNKAHQAQVQASLKPGASFGMTDVALSVIEPPRNSYQVFVDNQGVDSVGRHQLGMNFQHYGLVGLDDKFTAYVVAARGNTNANLAYSIPFNPWGGRLGVSFSRGQIIVYRGSYSSLGIEGQSENFGVNFAQPLYVGANWSLVGNGALSQITSVSTQQKLDVTDNLSLKRTWGATLAYIDPNLSLNVAPSFSYSHTKFQVTNTEKDFVFFNTAYSGLARLPFNLTATLNGALQWSDKKLLPGDQLFQLGGPTTVRGFPTSGVAGFAGYYANVELHRNVDDLLGNIWGWNKNFDGFLFVDHGSVFNTYPARVNLRSVGVGVSWTAMENVAAEVSLAVPITDALVQQSHATMYFRLTGKI